ncbi:alpha-ketoglutarate-dependent 2,4-dichlorophenoxyacetate dioxygenase [Plenodomus tracheiphilus IPT5]|uniref:Alpha-ketoglutarate-dependent 2,4-dichlorophenoxyacetate dioxygenase n=1 Tax=Plenodomus tracheiphilus IPT5 TaxID=1408161 RepID=A0A6A7ATN2_9PLEO|nr:alpha-ketoglutarate-dependent 2,4-dichlorophenoxyacetate dioxygenase [Plenodomus tracheiphilus IPT5]
MDHVQTRRDINGGGTDFKTFSVTELHPTFGAEIEGVNFPNPSEEQFKELLQAMAKYGFCVFRNTGMDDTAHVEFSRKLGDLDDIRPYMTNGRKLRYQYYELFDAGNVDDDSNIIDPNSPKAQYQKGNALWHVDSSFNPRRASYSVLLAHKLPPPGHGGTTDFSDSRTAFDDLSLALKTKLLQNDYTAAHSLAHSRKLAAPAFFADIELDDAAMNVHRIAQLHEPSGRMNLYVAAHAHHIVGLEKGESDELLSTLLKHATQDKYQVSVAWEGVGDMVIWDNTAVLHRAGEGTYAGKFVRDLRRTTVHDAGSTAWGLNERDGARRPGFEIAGK